MRSPSRNTSVDPTPAPQDLAPLDPSSLQTRRVRITRPSGPSTFPKLPADLERKNADGSEALVALLALTCGWSVAQSEPIGA